MTCSGKCHNAWYAPKGTIPVWKYDPLAMTGYGKKGTYKQGLRYCSVCQAYFGENDTTCRCCGQKFRTKSFYERRSRKHKINGGK